jgi:hypothetical protein
MSKPHDEGPIICAQREQLLEIYKLFTHTADRVRERRDRTSQVFIALIIAIVSGSAALMTGEGVMRMNYCLALVSSIIIVVISFLWLSSAYAFRIQLQAKREVLMDMEERGLVC